MRPGWTYPPETELFLILAARAAFVRRVVAPALESGAWVLSDRFDLSTLAYQGYGRRIDLAVIRELNRAATGGLVPDFVPPPRPSTLRRGPLPGNTGRGREAIGSSLKGWTFSLGSGMGMLSLPSPDPRSPWSQAAGSPDEVEERVRAVVRARFPETFGTPGGLGVKKSAEKAYRLLRQALTDRPGPRRGRQCGVMKVAHRMGSDWQLAVFCGGAGTTVRLVLGGWRLRT